MYVSFDDNTGFIVLLFADLSIIKTLYSVPSDWRNGCY